MSEDDIEYFESETGFVKVFNFFVTAISKGKKGVIKAKDFEYYLDWSMPDFLDVLT